MQKPVTLAPTRKLACLTLDYETDYGNRLGETFNILNETEKLGQLQRLFGALEIPVSAFIRTDLLTRRGGALDLVRQLATDFHCHSHTHATEGFESEYEIRTTQETFTKHFGKPALGYRAPLGILHKNDIGLLEEQGFKFSSSVFPVAFPGRYNNRRMPTTPFAWDNGIVELPLGAVQGLRLTVSLSFIKLLSLTLSRAIYSLFGLPNILIFNTHLHDFITCDQSFNALPRRLRLAWGINKHAGMSHCSSAVQLLKKKGYEFVSMTEVYEHVACQLASQSEAG